MFLLSWSSGKTLTRFADVTSMTSCKKRINNASCYKLWQSFDLLNYMENVIDIQYKHIFFACWQKYVYILILFALSFATVLIMFYLKVTVFFLTVYLENWEYSQWLLSEETLPNNSCKRPDLPPAFSSSPFLFLIFAFSCFGVW